MTGRALLRTAATLAALLAPLAAAAADYLLTVTRPNTLHLIDVAARKVVRSYPIPGDGVPATISLADDGKVAYVLTNRFESLVGIDLDSGRQVFRADMSSPGMRVKALLGMTVSRDGRKLYVHQIPTRIGRAEFESLDTRIAVYDTSHGLAAKPLKTFPAPRRISLLAPGASSERVIGLGWDLYVFDAEAGKIDRTYPLRHWQRAGFGEPDVLDMWSQYEQARVLSTPYYVARTDVDPKLPEAFKVGIMNFDLDNEKMDFVEVDNAETAIFSSVVNPVKRSEVFTVMNQVYRADLEARKFTQRINLDKTHYAINISSDGKEVYLGGALDTITVYATADLTKLAEIQLPGGADQSVASIRMLRR